MRYALVSDVHANLVALQAVVAALDGEPVDGWLCTGDLVGYGPSPDACVELLAGLGAVCVAGNHDLMALGALAPDRAGPTARSTLDWTAQTLSPASRAFLAALPRTLRVGPLLLAHGSPTDPQEYLTSTARADEVLDEVDGGCEALLLGHTHHPWAYARRDGTLLRRGEGVVRLDRAQRHLLNPGSVGQSRERAVLARFAVLDLDAGTVAFRAVGYDVARCDALLAEAGLPPGTYQLRPAWPQRARSAVGRTRRRVTGQGVPSV